MIQLLPLGRVDEEVLSAIHVALGNRLHLRARRLPPAEHPRNAYDPRRRQFNAHGILDALTAREVSEGRVLAITEQDLFVPLFERIFGEAQLAGQAAVLSLARLRPEFYGLPPVPGVLRGRAVKEALHEAGHLVGLHHCQDRDCLMCSSVTVTQVDRKSTRFCAGCRQFLPPRPVLALGQEHGLP